MTVVVETTTTEIVVEHNGVATVVAERVAVAASAPLGTYVHPQAVASTVWAVSHGLGFRAPNVELIDDVGVEFQAEIDFVDDNNLIVTVSPATAGTAYVS